MPRATSPRSAATARLVGVAGRDEAGRRLLGDAQVAAASTSAASCGPPATATPTKTRILAGGIHSAKQQVVRIDRAAADRAIDDEDARGVRSAGPPRRRGADALLVSDYGSGLITAAARRRSRRVRTTTATGPRRLALQPAEVPRHDRLHAERVRGRAGAGITIGDNPRALERAGRALLDKTQGRRRADHARQPRHGAVRAPTVRRSTSRSSARIRSPTSPAPATPSSRR